MSHTVPASLRAGPATTNTLVHKGYLLFYLLILWIAITPIIIFSAYYIHHFRFNFLFLLWSFPLILFLAYFVFISLVILLSWLFLQIVNLIHRPREGVFPRESKNKDFKFWSLRAIIKKLPLWISHSSPIPWMDNLAFKIFGNHLSLTTPVYDGWVDAEFLEIGHGTTIGQGAVIMTSMLTVEFLIIKKVRIGKDCLVGAHSVISPGTEIGDQVIVGALSSTTINQKLENNWIYWGNPVAKFKEVSFRETDTLSAEERARKKKYKEVTDVLSDSAELRGRKSAKAYLQIQKSDYMKKRAKRLHAKAEHQRSKAEYRARKIEIRADRRDFKAEQSIYDSIVALEKAKAALEAKIIKNRERLSKIEEREYEKEFHKLEKISLKETKKNIKKEFREQKKEIKKKEE